MVGGKPDSGHFKSFGPGFDPGARNPDPWNYTDWWNSSVSPNPSRPKASPRSPKLLTIEEAEALEGLFSVLASATRTRLLRALTVLDDPCMSELAEAVGMKPQAVSNQLRKLAEMGILSTRRHGNHIHYSLVDARLSQMLEHGLSLNEGRARHLTGSVG